MKKLFHSPLLAELFVTNLFATTINVAIIHSTNKFAKWKRVRKSDKKDPHSCHSFHFLLQTEKRKPSAHTDKTLSIFFSFGTIMFWLWECFIQHTSTAYATDYSTTHIISHREKKAQQMRFSKHSLKFSASLSSFELIPRSRTMLLPLQCQGSSHHSARRCLFKEVGRLSSSVLLFAHHKLNFPSRRYASLHFLLDSSSSAACYFLENWSVTSSNT